MNRKENRFQKSNIVWIVCIAIVVLFLVFINAYIIVKAEGQSVPEHKKIYKSITIEQNQTLWDIAEEYCNDDYYDNKNEYIDEIMQINQLQTDLIYEGYHLIVVNIEKC